MRETRLIMGMPIEVEMVEGSGAVVEEVFTYLESVDARFSTYKESSEIMQLNRGEVALANTTEEMQEVFAIAEKTKRETNGHFDIRRPDGLIDPSGIVKGWAIRNAARLMRERGGVNYFVNAGGDIAAAGKNSEGGEWSVGIKNPFDQSQIVKVLYPRGKGVATSGSYIRGAHIYNPLDPGHVLGEVVSTTVIGPDVLEADRFATAVFAMGRKGVAFIEQLPGFEAYSIDKDGIATMTSGFEEYTKP